MIAVFWGNCDRIKTRPVIPALAGVRVGTGSMAGRGYVPEQPATQCEGTCARDCTYLISAVVTKPGPTAKERDCRYVALVEYKPQHCQRQ